MLTASFHFLRASEGQESGRTFVYCAIEGSWQCQSVVHYGYTDRVLPL